jgi:transposase
MKRYVLNLTDDERAALEVVAAREQRSREKGRRARILLLADECLTDEEICEELNVGSATVQRVRKRACLEGISAALERKPQAAPPRKPVLDGRAEAQLVTLACSSPPDGRARWTLTLLAERLVQLEVVEAVSVSTVRRRLKKTASSRGE